MAHAGAAVTIAVLSRDPGGEQVAERRVALADAVRRAPEAELLVLPYLAAHPPFWRVLDRAAGFRHAERHPYPSLLAVQDAARERRLASLASVYEALGEGVFYAFARVSGPTGEALCSYRQWHALNQPGTHERLYLQPGSGDDPPVFACAGISIGILMGGDLWVPEAARLLRLAGAELLLTLTPAPADRLDEIQTLAAARSIENGVPVILADRGGPPIVFGTGASVGDDRDGGEWRTIVADPITMRAALHREDPLMMRRPRLYAPLARRWEVGAP